MAAATSEKKPAYKNNERRKDSPTGWTVRLIEYERNRQDFLWGVEDLNTWEQHEAEAQNWQYKNSIEYEKNRQDFLWGVENLNTWEHDEVDMQNWQYENSKKLEEIHSNILYHGDGEEVVWQDDVWGLQKYTQIPPENQPRADDHKGKAK